MALPVIDASPLFTADKPARARLAASIAAACRTFGFFYVTGHGIEPAVLENLAAASRRFFALPQSAKEEIAMSRGGRAWRGWFPVGGELTSGKPDVKEGIYFGTELPGGDPRPLHGANLFPAQVPELRAAVFEYQAQATRAAHALMEGLALSLGLDDQYFRRTYTSDPTALFRVFHYPPASADVWGVGEHTDYGLLTLLAQDDVGGLEVKAPGGWIEAPPLPGTLVCNIGDMLDKLTGGWFKSTPHRVRNVSGRERYSFPFFFDPAFEARIVPLPLGKGEASERWDQANVHAFEGTYGEYLLAKVGKVFPVLRSEVL
ncbi:MAG: isopenicillin N synthase family dioxygenase [Bdellovibrionota bacterium]